MLSTSASPTSGSSTLASAALRSRLSKHSLLQPWMQLQRQSWRQAQSEPQQPHSSFQEGGSSGSGHQGQQPFLPDQHHRDEHMQAKEEIAGGTINKAALQNAAAGKKILTEDRGTVWAEIDSDVEELDCT